jgi:Rieske Fe-S protein
VIFAEQNVVVTQPTEGEFRGFDNICTHQGCPVSDVTDTINCNCHGSKFSLEDGSVVSAPATKALSAKQVTLVDGKILLA